MTWSKPTSSVSPDMEGAAVRFSRPSTALVATALISAIIAMIQPFDLGLPVLALGFFVAEVASVGCHVFLQPALGYLVA